MQVDLPLLLGLALVLALFNLALGWWLSARVSRARHGKLEEEARAIVETARQEAEAYKHEKELEARDEWHRQKLAFEEEARIRRAALLSLEQQVQAREEGIERHLDLLNEKDEELKAREAELARRLEDVKERRSAAETLVEEQTRRLERISGMARDDAKRYLVENLVNEARTDAAQALKDIRDAAKAEARAQAQRIIIQAIQRTASEYSVETTVSVVHLQSEEMKGRIIGREGRNIRAFESSTGVDVIVDDTPDAVIVSSFDPFRREIARVALERLMADGRIHPARIEEVVEKVKAELEEDLVRIGNDALLECGIHNVHPEIARHVGRMRYRTSYGQNLLLHSIEVSYLCGIMAAELGLDPDIAKRSGLLHDLGKVVDRNTEGPHALLGHELAKKFREHPAVVNAIGSHHEEMEMETPYAVLVQAADAISGARPGARRESLEGYIKRLEKLESVARSFDGVLKTYAIQAGREVRVIVEPERVDDLTADRLANDIAKKILHDMEFPGQIKVTVIRERRATAFAK